MLSIVEIAQKLLQLLKILQQLFVKELNLKEFYHNIKFYEF
jgi:hypothetical protein